MFGEILAGDGVRKLYVYDKGDVPVLYHYRIFKYIKKIFEKHVEFTSCDRNSRLR